MHPSLLSITHFVMFVKACIEVDRGRRRLDDLCNLVIEMKNQQNEMRQEQKAMMTIVERLAGSR
jgi:hypothetical protein